MEVNSSNRNYHRAQLKQLKCKLQVNFLQNCLEEKVLPRSAPAQLRDKTIPFTSVARDYLKNAIITLKEKIEYLRLTTITAKLSHKQTDQLKRTEYNEKKRLDAKLRRLCDRSSWKTVGNSSLITNLSSKHLTKYQREVLSLGSNFDTGVNKNSLSSLISKNYKWQESDIDKGFQQGILACCNILSKKNSILPKRYLIALTSLKKDESIIIKKADKGGGIVVMNTKDYTEKIVEHLSDENVYEKKYAGYAEKIGNDFNKNARKILRKSKQGKQFLHLIEENPVIPRIYGLPKLHKMNVPVRPITSCIGSAPHKLSKFLAKYLTPLLGEINKDHIRNSGDILKKLESVNFKNKVMASFDVASLYTNINKQEAVNVMEQIIETTDINLPMEKNIFIGLVKLCVDYNCLEFEKEEYIQHSGYGISIESNSGQFIYGEYRS